MDRPYRYITVEQRPPVFCVRLRKLALDDFELEEVGAEMARLVDEEGCRKLILVLGPGEPHVLYSVFLAKLLNLQKRLASDSGVLAIAELGEAGRAIFQAAGLERFFRFFPDLEAAQVELT